MSNATPYELATHAAKEIADMRARGVGPAEIEQLANDIDGWIGQRDDTGRLVWPMVIAELAGLKSRRPAARTAKTADLASRASQIAGACWDDRDKTGSLAEQLRTVAATPALGADGDLTDADRTALLALADEAE